MIKPNVSTVRSTSEGRAGECKLGQRPFALALLALGLLSSACLSDVTVPACATQGKCIPASGGGGSGSATIGGAGVGGEPETGDSGSGGDGGDAASGGSMNSSGGDGGMPGGGLGGNAAGGGDGGTTGGSGGGGGFASGGSSGGGGSSGFAGGGSSGGPPLPPPSPTALPAPCKTDPYSTSLRATGGIAPYSWKVSPSVEGWEAKADPDHSDSSYGLLVGAHAGAAEITVVVRDAAEREGTATYQLTPRSSCWFAYSTWTAADGATLNVVDPILEKTPPVTLANNHDVYDFAFSPDGKYLSYRFGSDATHEKGRYLAVVNLATWVEQQLSLSDGPSANDIVTAYAWSGDSSTLAVSFTSGGVQYLGGARFAANGQLDKLTRRQTAIDSELYWVQSSYLAFYANGLWDQAHPDQLIPQDGFVTAFYSALGATGFEKAKLSTDQFYSLPVSVQTASDGFYVNSPSWSTFRFNWIRSTGPTGIDHSTDYQGRIISPSGRITADPPLGALNLYRAESPDQMLTSTNAPDRDCPFLSTWAKGRERMACVRAVPANAQGKKHSELRIFDLDDNGSLSVRNVPGYCVKDAQSVSAADPCAGKEYDYSTAGANLTPRVFSQSGKWLAFAPNSAGADISYLYVADLSSDQFQISFKHGKSTLNADPSMPSKLAFSPSEMLLLREVAGSLTAYSVSGFYVPLPDFAAETPDDNPTCSEDFVRAPERWCGSADRNAPFNWSSTSKFAAYRSTHAPAGATLTVADFSAWPSTKQHFFPAPNCGTNCRGQFTFQP